MMDTSATKRMKKVLFLVRIMKDTNVSKNKVKERNQKGRKKQGIEKRIFFRT